MTDRYELRAADADRDRVAEILQEAHSEGRLGQDELVARVDAAFSARTYGELDRLIADLPMARRAAPALSRPAPAPAGPRTGVGRRVARATLTVAWWIFGVVLAINVLVWMLVSAANGIPEYFWPLWVAGPWGVLLGALEMAYRSRYRSG